MNAAELLAAIADVMLPGDDHWPAAGALDLGPAMSDLAELTDAGRAALAAVETAPPAALADAAAAAPARTAALAHLEATRPLIFQTLRLLAYEAYYTHPRVQEVLAERCGWRPGPAQPLGYPQVFTLDAAPDLSGVRARGVQWRPDGTPISAAVRAAQESDPDRRWSEEEIWQWQR